MSSRRVLVDHLRLVVVTPGRGPRVVTSLVDRLFEPGEASGETGASALWLRERQLADGEIRDLTRSIRPRLEQAGAALILAGRPRLAAELELDACHLGFRDAAPTAVRADLDDHRLSLGYSMHDPLTSTDDIDYCTLSPVFPSPKAHGVPTPLGLDRFRELCAALPCPVVGLGGIDARHAADVVAAGAVGVAVMRAVTEDPDPASVARALRRQIDEGTP